MLFYCIVGQINAALVNIKDLFKLFKKGYKPINLNLFPPQIYTYATKLLIYTEIRILPY